MNGTLKRLDAVHEKLSQAIRTTNPNLFSKRPGEHEWTIAEVVQHLCLVEERVIDELQKSVERGPAKVGFLKKLIPLRIISLRLVKVKAPGPVRPLDPPPMNELLNTYDRLRANLKQVCHEYGAARLKTISLKHPFLGDIDGTAAVAIVGYHEERHYKQIQEILKKVQAAN